MASVRKLKPDDPRSPWVVEYTDQGGKRRRLTPKSGLKKDADRERQRIESEMQAGVHTALDESVTVEQASREFLKDLDRRVKLGDITRGSLVNYESCIRRGVIPRFGARKVASITSEEVQQWVDDLRLKYMPRTILGYHLAIMLVMTFSVRKKWVKRNVLKDQPCRLPAPQKRKAIPSRSDLKALMEAIKVRQPTGDLCSHVVRRAFVALGVFGGLRPGEIYGLQWENVDFDSSVVRVRHSLSRTDGLKGPKSAAGIRDVPMSLPIREALMEVGRFATIRAAARSGGSQSTEAIHKRMYRMWGNPAITADIASLTGYVCVNRLGGPRFSESNNNLWDKLMKDAGLYDEDTKRSKFTPHALRHAAASLFIEAGLPAMNLKTVIGHSSVTTTYDVYGHLFPEDERTLLASRGIADQFDATKTRHNLLTD